MFYKDFKRKICIDHEMAWFETNMNFEHYSMQKFSYLMLPFESQFENFSPRSRHRLDLLIYISTYIFFIFFRRWGKRFSPDWLAPSQLWPLGRQTSAKIKSRFFPALPLDREENGKAGRRVFSAAITASLQSVFPASRKTRDVVLPRAIVAPFLLKSL